MLKRRPFRSILIKFDVIEKKCFVAQLVSVRNSNSSSGYHYGYFHGQYCCTKLRLDV